MPSKITTVGVSEVMVEFAISVLSFSYGAKVNVLTKKGRKSHDSVRFTKFTSVALVSVLEFVL